MKVLCHFRDRVTSGHECVLGEPTEAQIEQLARRGFEATCETMQEYRGDEATARTPAWTSVRATWVDLVARWLQGNAADTTGLKAARKAVMELARREIGPLVPRIKDVYPEPPEKAAMEFVEEWDPENREKVLVVARPLDDEARALGCWKGDAKAPFLVIGVWPTIEVTWSAQVEEEEQP